MNPRAAYKERTRKKMSAFMARCESSEHGTRKRYTAGCRCAECRAANCAYEKDRYRRAREGKHSHRLVDAAKSRSHLRKLSGLGVGMHSVAAATDMSRTVLMLILNGSRKRVRHSSEQKILAVNKHCRADHALISSAETKALIAELRDEGYTEAFLAGELGYTRPQLQFHSDKITVRNAARVAALHRRLTT